MNTISESEWRKKLEHVYRQTRQMLEFPPTVRCGCHRLLQPHQAYRCLYCGEWFCRECGEEHFGQSVIDYRSENPVDGMTTEQVVEQTHGAAQQGREDDMSNIIRDKVFECVRAERERQVSEEGCTPEHDDQYRHGELARAGAGYALRAAWDDEGVYVGELEPVSLRPAHWPWGSEWWKPTTPDRDLEKAAALIVAEMERRARAAQQGREY